MMKSHSLTDRIMGSKKSFIKGLAAGAVLGAVAVMLHAMQDKDDKAGEMADVAMRIKDKVAQHAKTLGALTKEAYGSIVDTTVAEYRGVKALGEDELKDVSKELKGSWKDVQAVMRSKPTAKKKRV
jgi:gas vesicle protein